MLLTNHTLTGVALGLTIDDVAVLAPTAVASHYVLDSVPHFGSKRLSFDKPAGRIFAFFDCLVASCVAISAVIIWPHRFGHLFVGIFGAALPDLHYVPYYVLKKRFWTPLINFHHLIQTERLWLLPVEIVWAFTMITAIKVYL